MLMDLVTRMNGEMMLLPVGVQIWMVWMMAIFMSSLFFVKDHKPARFAILAFMASMPAGGLIFYLTGNVHLLGLAHFMFWLPLLGYLIKTEFLVAGVQRSAYGLWTILIALTIVTCLTFDVRDLYLVCSGHK